MATDDAPRNAATARDVFPRTLATSNCSIGLRGPRVGFSLPSTSANAYNRVRMREDYEFKLAFPRARTDTSSTRASSTAPWQQLLAAADPEVGQESEDDLSDLSDLSGRRRRDPDQEHTSRWTQDVALAQGTPRPPACQALRHHQDAGTPLPHLDLAWDASRCQ
ncbi:hypothetical protein BC828DRAFT_407205 [Blastocladiella britannica]|nr:hypothetical protein BC828DRAFT_407205 [Blastocladiella britannica]